MSDDRLTRQESAATRTDRPSTNSPFNANNTPRTLSLPRGAVKGTK